MNSITISGNITRDIQLRRTQAGRGVCTFSVACNRTAKKPNGEEAQYTDYVNVQAWGQLAENIAGSLHKGDRVIVTGRWSTRKYQSKDGREQYMTEVVADEAGPSLLFAQTSGAPRDEYGFEAPSDKGGFGRFGKAEEDIPF